MFVLNRSSLFLISAACLLSSQAMAASSFDRERGVGGSPAAPATNAVGVVPTAKVQGNAGWQSNAVAQRQNGAPAVQPQSAPAGQPGAPRQSSFDRERGISPTGVTSTGNPVANPNALGTVVAPPAVESSNQ